MVISSRSAWLLSLALSALAAWVNYAISAHGNGRLTFMALWPAVILAGYLGGWRHVAASAGIGAASVFFFHPEMTDGRTPGEIGAVVLFLFNGGCFASLADFRLR